MTLTRKISAVIAGNLLAVAVFTGGCLPGTAATEATAVTIKLDLKHPGAVIPDDFAGLSFEATRLLPDTNGVHYFRPDNQPLIHIFQTLGIRNLRIGGNTSDRDARQLPGPADWDSLFAFAQTAQVKVIYGLQLYKGNPQVAAQTVKYIMDHYAPLVDAFAIGQEPSAYPTVTEGNRPANAQMGPGAEHFKYSAYAKEWRRFAEVIAAAVPHVKFCGPGVHNNGPWTRDFIADFGRSHHVSLITAHLYAGGAGDKVPTPEIGRDQMLSDRFEQTYQKLYDSFVPQVAADGLPFRLEEANSFYNAGAAGVSDTFASALWGLDFLHWWAAHGAAGLNFHTGDQVAAGPNLRPTKYAVFLSITNGYRVCPLGYGLKAFNLGGHGKIIPVTIENSRQINFTAYAVQAEDGMIYVTVINKEHGSEAKNLTARIRSGGDGFRDGQVMYLAVPNQDVAAPSGQTLGGAEISSAGDFAGRWQNLPPAGKGTDGGVGQVLIPAASAAVIKLTPNNLVGVNVNR